MPPFQCPPLASRWYEYGQSVAAGWLGIWKSIMNVFVCIKLHLAPIQANRLTEVKVIFVVDQSVTSGSDLFEKSIHYIVDA